MLEAATIGLACKYYPIFGFEFTDGGENMETVCKTRPRLRGDRLDVNPLVRASHEKMWNMHLDLETYNDKLRPRIRPLEDSEPVMFLETVETEIDGRINEVIREEEAAGGGPAPSAAQEGSGRSRKRKRSLKKNKKPRKNKTKTLKRKVGRNTSKKRKVV